MSDAIGKTDTIDKNDPEDIKRWADRLGVSVEDIERAIASVGPIARYVKDYLGA